MDRQQAAVHYVSQAEIALKSTLDWCNETYGDVAADRLSRLFTELVFGENLLTYCDMDEVLSLWGVVSRWSITERVYGGEFIVAFNQQFNMYVEPAVIASAQDATSLSNLTPLGAHLVASMARNHPLVVMPQDKFHDELAGYQAFFGDVPKPDKIVALLSYFPWMAPMWLLCFSAPTTLKAIISSYVMNQGAQGQAAPGAQ